MKRPSAVFIVMVLLVSVSYAMDPPEFLRQAVTLARENNREIQEMRQVLKIAESGVATADTRRYPIIRTDLWSAFSSVVPEMVQPESVITTPAGDVTVPGRTTTLGDYDRYGVDLELTHLLYAGGRLNGAVELARQQTEVVAGQLAVRIRHLDREVTHACLDLLRLTLLESAGEKSLELARNHGKDIRNLEAAGTVTENEVLKAELRSNEAEAALLDIQRQIEIQKLQLRILTGNEIHISLASGLEGLDLDQMAPERENSISQAVIKRAELLVNDCRIAAAAFSADLIHREKRPVISGFAKASYGKPGPDFVRNEWIDSYSAGFNCSLTLWDFHRVDNRVVEIRGEIERLRLERKVLESMIDLEVTRSIIGIESANRHREVAVRALGQAEENFRITSDGFNQGILTNTDYLDAETALDKSRTDAIIHRTNCLKAWIDYYLAIGLDILKEGLS